MDVELLLSVSHPSKKCTDVTALEWSKQESINSADSLGATTNSGSSISCLFSCFLFVHILYQFGLRVSPAGPPPAYNQQHSPQLRGGGPETENSASQLNPHTPVSHASASSAPIKGPGLLLPNQRPTETLKNAILCLARIEPHRICDGSDEGPLTGDNLILALRTIV